jgi:hypothetical protein
VGPGCQREKEREEARSGWGQGKAGPGVAHAGRRRKRGEGDGPWGKKGPAQGGGGEAGWAAFSNSFPFSFSNPF